MNPAHSLRITAKKTVHSYSKEPDIAGRAGSLIRPKPTFDFRSGSGENMPLTSRPIPTHDDSWGGGTT